MMECMLGTRRIKPGDAFYQPLAGQVILWLVEEISVTGRGSSFRCYADPDSEEWFFESNIGQRIFFECSEAEKFAADEARREASEL